jgi:hypothetical protein
MGPGGSIGSIVLTSVMCLFVLVAGTGVTRHGGHGTTDKSAMEPGLSRGDGQAASGGDSQGANGGDSQGANGGDSQGANGGDGGGDGRGDGRGDGEAGRGRAS